MSDDEKWSRDGGKKEEDIDDIPEAEATLIPEVKPILPTPAGNTAAPPPKNPGVSWTISVNEAVNYGFKSIKGVLPYLIVIISCYAVSSISFYVALSLSLSSEEGAEIVEKAYLGLSFIFFVIGILLQLSLMVGLGYKFGGDILLRAIRFHHLIERKK
tara:strand:+ start:61 stop:534 length:474 start_codon:yes stop_codon:yes gene_type:complete